MSTIICCCDTTPPNICDCTWPRVLSYLGNVGQAAATFYFPNTPDGGIPEPVYTLTWGSLPSDIPKELQLLFYNNTGNNPDPWYITMPDEAWFSPPIACHVFGLPTSVYFYMWMESCSAHVLVIDAPYGTNSPPSIDNTKGAGNNVVTYFQTQCDPIFQMKNNLGQPPKIYGSHGGDDIVPIVGGAAGPINGRQGKTYALTMTLHNPTGGGISYSVAAGGTRNGIVAANSTYTVPPGASVTWSSSNMSVATVAPNANTATAVVTAVAPGTSVITATFSGDANITNGSSPQTLTVT